MARVRLTAGRVRDFQVRPGQKQSFLWDTEAPWLAVRATAGAKVYIFQSTIGGRSLRTKIGSVEAWGIDKARAEARRLQTVIDQGIDPRRERELKAAAERAEQEAIEAEAERTKAEAEANAAEVARRSVLVSVPWTAYLEDRRGRWGARYYTDHLNLSRPGGEPKKRGKGLTTPGPLAPLMERPLSDLDPDALRHWLRGEAGLRPTQARQAFGALRAFFGWLEDQPEYRGIVAPESRSNRPGRQELPRKGVKNDVLQREQLPAWFAAVRQIGNPVISAYLQVLLLTGPRREELAPLKWADVDFRWGSITIKDKVDGERTIPLTPYVADLLAALPRRKLPDGSPSPWVFSSATSASGHLTEPRIAHNKALAIAGLPPLSLHGLRRSFGTLSEWVEMPTGVVAQIQGHKPSATAERHYRRRPLDLLRVWHTKLEGWILAEAGIEQPKPANGERVTPLRAIA